MRKFLLFVLGMSYSCLTAFALCGVYQFLLISTLNLPLTKLLFSDLFVQIFYTIIPSFVLLFLLYFCLKKSVLIVFDKFNPLNYGKLKKIIYLFCDFLIVSTILRLGYASLTVISFDFESVKIITKIKEPLILSYILLFMTFAAAASFSIYSCRQYFNKSLFRKLFCSVYVPVSVLLGFFYARFLIVTVKLFLSYGFVS